MSNKEHHKHIEIYQYYQREQKYHQDQIDDIDKLLKELSIEETYQCYDVAGIPNINDKKELDDG